MDLLEPALSAEEHLRARAGVDFYGLFPDISRHSSVRQVRRMTNLLGLFSNLFDAPAAAFDHVTTRAAGPGTGSDIHCDWVYMCRGTVNLLTAWIPIVNVPLKRGPVMVLENSHLPNEFTRSYLKLDHGRPDFLDDIRLRCGELVRSTKYSGRADLVQKQFGTRWLTEEFHLGDMLIFGPRCLHTTLDNATSKFRLSLDTRFQPATELMDPRFVGSAPELYSGSDKTAFDHWAQLKKLTRSFLR
jgi:hypothetical protein